MAQLSKPVCQLQRVFSPTAQKSQLCGEKTGGKPKEGNTGAGCSYSPESTDNTATVTDFKTAGTAGLTDLKISVLIKIRDF